VSPPTVAVAPKPVAVTAASLAPAKLAAPAPATPAAAPVKVETVAVAATPLVVAAATPASALTRDFKTSPSFSAAADDDGAPISTAR
jgi:hypothetical protein